MDRTDFYDKVYEIVMQIPAGKVTTYGAIAGCIGVKSGARMVGYALNNLAGQSDGESVPAHRVVNRLGQLTGRAYFEGDVMKERLEQEGVEFKEEYTVHIEKHFWDPAENIGG
ncbi:MGMT family protein [Rhodohalobacter halophilus]|uniref:MGMT family protein n=1 Tax=Rhodohalobacter halophilus TaxID=1812810 RepID=UPI00083FD538|nr:MGMT family protein [Rhodohalobacter halophilus]